MRIPEPTSAARYARLFRNNRSQAVRIPAEFEFPGSRVLIRKEGDRLIIEPKPRPDLVAVLRGLTPLDADDQLNDDLDSTLLPVGSIEL